jgi:predicted secreted protein
MRRTILTLAIPLALVLGGAGAGCSSGTTAATGGGNPAGSAQPDTTEQKKVFKQDQTDIRIGVGETFAIRLPADPSTGDSWDMVSAPDDSFVKADGSSFKPDANAEPGAPGQIEFKFKAKKAGPTSVTFMQCDRCGGEGTIASTVPNGEPAQRLTFKITVG